MTALSECIAETRQKAAAGVAAGGPGVEAAGVVAGGDGGDGEGRGKGGDGKSGKNGGDGELEISGKKKRFTGALERAGLCGPLGGPAIPPVPGAAWETPAFVDLLADAMLTKEAVDRRRAALAASSPDGALRPLVQSSTEVGRALGAIVMPTTAPEQSALNDARQNLVSLGDLALSCPAGSADNSRFLHWLELVIERVRNIPRGRCLLLPGGWCTKQGGHALVYAVHRREHSYSLAVSNTGDGLEYHPQEADPGMDGYRAMHTIQLDDIEPGVLTDTSSWALLYRPLIFPAPGRTQSELIYAKVLPFLNKRPLMASAMTSARSDGAGNATHPLSARARSGDASGARLALEAARAAVASSPGVAPRRADALVEMGTRHALLESTMQDLAAIPGRGLLGAAPAAALECACRTLSAVAGPHADALAETPPGIASGVNAVAQATVAAPQPRAPDPFGDPFAPAVRHDVALTSQPRPTGPVVEPEFLARVIRCVEGVLQRVSQLRQPALLPPPLLRIGPADVATPGAANANANATDVGLPDMRCPSAACSAPLYGRLATANDGGEKAIEKLAGRSQPPPIVRPIELTLVPDRVNTILEASGAMRKAVHCCVLLANQSELLPNTFALRASLLTHLFCAVLPAPLPIDHPRRREKCFWASKTVRYETQAELLRCLRLSLHHFTSTALSLTATRSFDAARLLSIASLASIADAVMRLRVTDHPSPFCTHYAGEADGPVSPFGFEMGPFGVEAEYLRFHCPERTGRLTQVLDYFHGMKHTVATDHLIFRWERSTEFGEGDGLLLKQVCLQMGFPMTDEELPFYLSGESRELGDNYPELTTMRDIVFMFKAMMTPTSDSLPELRRWRPRDAALWWKYKPGEGFDVHGFNRKLEVLAWKEGDAGDKGTGWLSALGGGFLASLFGIDRRPRCPPSGGNPSNLAGERVDTEEDVLHLKDLPTFDGLLRPSESELLLTYLTAPYLRIPLALRHFADPQRVRALGHKQIQGVLDACFFEPGPWQPPGTVAVPAEIPAPSRAHMATPAGLLLHELSNAPAPLVDAAEEILALSLELDTGRHDAPVAAGVLYAARLMTRMHAFVRYLLTESGWGDQVDEAPLAAFDDPTWEPGEGTEDHTSRGCGGWSGGSGARGVRCPGPAARPLLHAAARLRAALDDRVRPTLRRWLSGAVRNGATKAACVLHAHLAYLHWSTPSWRLDRRATQTVLTAQAYILVNHSFHDATEGGAKLRGGKNDGGDVDEGLGFAPTEIFDLFQRQRRGVLTWMRNNPELADAVLEEVVSVLTLNSSGDDYEREHQALLAAAGGSGAAAGVGAGGNMWSEIGDWFGDKVDKLKKKGKGGKDAAPSDDEAAIASLEAGESEATESAAGPRGKSIDERIAVASKKATDRRWVQVPGPGGAGRFIPETEAAAAAAAAGVPLVVRPAKGTDPMDVASSSSSAAADASSLGAKELTGTAAVSVNARAAGVSYEEWMRSVTTMAVDMEINAQLGEFTVRKNRLKALQYSVREMPDFTAALGATLANEADAAGPRERSIVIGGGTDGGGDGRRRGGRGGRGDEAGIDGGGVESGSDDDDDDRSGEELVVHCAEVKRTEHRLWMRLVGLRHDVQLWDQDRRSPPNPFMRRYSPLFSDADIAAGLAGAFTALTAAVGAAGLAESERWIAERLDPVVAGPAAGYLAGVELFLPMRTVNGPIAHLAGYAKLPDGDGMSGSVYMGAPTRDYPGDGDDSEDDDDEHDLDALAASVDGDGKSVAADPKKSPSKKKDPSKKKKKDSKGKKTKDAHERGGALTEVVVLRDPPLVQVFRVESHGRKWRRALVFASSASWCLADVDPDGAPALEDPAERYLLSAARLGAAASSLVVTRHLSAAQGRQQFVPARHLRGLVPAALLRDYVFWQTPDGDFYGDPRPTASHPNTMIHAKLVKGAGADSGGTSGGDALSGASGEYAAVIRRIPLRTAARGDGGDDADADAADASTSGADQTTGVAPGSLVPDGFIPGQLTLVDLLYAPAVLASAVDASDPSRSSPRAKAATALRSLARCLAAVEGLAHCLAWTASPVDAKAVASGGVRRVLYTGSHTTAFAW